MTIHSGVTGQNKNKIINEDNLGNGAGVTFLSEQISHAFHVRSARHKTNPPLIASEKKERIRAKLWNKRNAAASHLPCNRP